MSSIPRAFAPDGHAEQIVSSRSRAAVYGLATTTRALALVHAVFMLGTLGAFLVSSEFLNHPSTRALRLFSMPTVRHQPPTVAAPGPTGGVPTPQAVPAASRPSAEALLAAAAGGGAHVERRPTMDQVSVCVRVCVCACACT